MVTLWYITLDRVGGGLTKNTPIKDIIIIPNKGHKPMHQSVCYSTVHSLSGNETNYTCSFNPL